MYHTGTALQRTDTLQVQQMENQDRNYLNAYNICLRCKEQFAVDEDKLRYVRILGYLLLHAPDRAVRSEVTRTYFISHFEKFKGQIPRPGSYLPRPSFGAVKSQMKVAICRAPRNHQGAKNRRCVVTGIYDINAPDDFKAQLDRKHEPGQATECVHIIPESTFFGVNPKSHDNLKLVWYLGTEVYIEVEEFENLKVV
ncbi:hypothetical protein BC827DRAFT_1159734 [Russula dissimulans]|nr:hypothetical protein BC827DRAFT_1159734 [Russula dissimulans]